MKTEAELQQLYDTQLVSELDTLEPMRKKLLNKILFSWMIIIGLIAGAVITGINQSNAMIFFIIISAIAIIIFTIFYSKAKRHYVSEFKNKIILKIVKFVDENLNYNPLQCVSITEFQSSGIFNQRIDRYRGDDLVEGKLDKTQIMFSELHAEYKTTTTDSKGHRHTHWHTIFKGLFFIADFNKNFNCRVVVLPDVAESMFGFIGKFFQKINVTRDQLITLEDPEFEKAFVVYSNDQVEARYILSTSLMRRILDFKNKTGRHIYISFVDSKIYVAISYTKSLFEPKVFSSLKDFSQIKEYFEDLQLAISIVDELNLNTRIWTK